MQPLPTNDRSRRHFVIPKLACSLFSGLLALFAAPTLEAQSLLYHFSGVVSQIEFDDAGLVAASGLQLGSPVEYGFLVDFQRPGTITHYDGSIEALEDLPHPGDSGNTSTHYFYDDFLGGNFLRDDGAEQLRPANGWLESNYGALIEGPFQLSGSLVGGGVNHSVSVYQQSASAGVVFLPPLPWGYVYGDPSVQAWQLGAHMLAVSSASNVDLQGSLFRAEVTLDRITAVPEPCAIVLLLGGTWFYSVWRWRWSVARLIVAAFAAAC